VSQADAALIGWLRYALPRAGDDMPALRRFIARGQELSCAPRSDVLAGAQLDEWRQLARRGVALIGRAFDPSNETRAWAPRQTGRRAALGVRLYADPSFRLPGAPQTRLPSWDAWVRDLLVWKRERDARFADDQRRFAAERTRLRLESLWAAPGAGPAAPPGLH
jgi:hypothetical protein